MNLQVLITINSNRNLLLFVCSIIVVLQSIVYSFRMCSYTNQADTYLSVLYISSSLSIIFYQTCAHILNTSSVSVSIHIQCQCMNERTAHANFSTAIIIAISCIFCCRYSKRTHITRIVYKVIHGYKTICVGIQHVPFRNVNN